MEAKELKRGDEKVSHLALDIGGTLIKMVYFSTSANEYADGMRNGDSKDGIDTPNEILNYRILSGKIHFLKFETRKIGECINFISSKRLQHYGNHSDDLQGNVVNCSSLRVVSGNVGADVEPATYHKIRIASSPRPRSGLNSADGNSPSARLVSLDVFRGLTVALMIFVDDAYYQASTIRVGTV